MGAHIERIFRSHRRRYGYRRILEELADEGHVCAPARVRRLMARPAGYRSQALRPKDQRWQG
jgi:transposase InsO family protein